MNTARYMVEGCDIWLNNPRRPLEASGTSGMKVIANGGLNFSVLDGWWDEAYEFDTGWKIGNGEEYDDPNYQDEVEGRLIYEVLEKEIIPTYYERGEDRLPRRWISLMKSSMKKLGPVYNTSRMVEQYFEKFYLKSYEKRMLLKENEWEKAKAFSVWKQNFLSKWDNVKFVNYSQGFAKNVINVGEKIKVQTEIDLGDLLPQDVEVQVYYGKDDEINKPYKNSFLSLSPSTKYENSNVYLYEGEITCSNSGNFGYTFRILPKHSLFISYFDLALIKWA